MLQKFKSDTIQLLGSQNAKAVLILASLLMAALAGAAPHDIGN